MDWSIKQNRNYLLWMLVFCALIPHAVLMLLKMEHAAEPMGLATQESYSKFFVCQWTPFCAAIIAYLRLQKRDKFSLLPAVVFGLIVLTLLPGFGRIRETYMQHTHDENKAFFTALTILVMLLMECSAPLKRLESSHHRMLSAIATDRGILRAFFFWSIGVLCLAFISTEACGSRTTVVLPWSLIPIPGVMLLEVSRQQKERPPTIWGIMAMLLMVPVSLYLSTIGPMEMFRSYHFTCMLSGHLIVFLMLIVLNVDHWKHAKTAK